MRPPCQEQPDAPLGNNLSLMNKHISDLARVMGSLLRNLCHLEYKFFPRSLALDQVEVEAPRDIRVMMQRQVAYLQQLSDSTSRPFLLSLCEDLSYLKQSNIFVCG